MARRADVMVDGAGGASAHWYGTGTNYIVQTPAGVLYMVMITAQDDVNFKKSSDGGLTWSQSTAIRTGTVTALAIWYDRWSGIAGGLIHCAYIEGYAGDTFYRTIDTEASDALSTQTVILDAGVSASTGHLSITRAKGGNVLCKTVVSTAGGVYRLANANVPNGAWDAARTIDETIAAGDQMILVPNLTSADTQDIMAFFWDASADEVSRKLYDDSANSWSETSIATSMWKLATTMAFANFDIAMDLTNSRVVLVAWSDSDFANADLRCWTVTDSAITEVTNVVLNSTDDQGLAAISIDSQTGYWHAFYGGKSDGSETFITALHIYTKVSRDSGTTWGPETQVDVGAVFDVRWLATTNWLYLGPPVVTWFREGGATRDVMMSVDRTVPRATYQLGA